MSRAALLLLLTLPACALFGLQKKEKPEPTSSRRVWCAHDGVTYAVGASREEGCNTCACVEEEGEKGAWSCTDAACDGTGHSGAR